jgi:hypothetical protein
MGYLKPLDQWRGGFVSKGFDILLILLGELIQ